MALGKNIYELRKKCGFSQEQLGEKVSVTRQTISNWELGETAPSSEQLKLLSGALNVSVDVLLDNDFKSDGVSRFGIGENQISIVKKIFKSVFIGFICFLVVDFVVFLICFFCKFGPFA